MTGFQIGDRVRHVDDGGLGTVSEIWQWADGRTFQVRVEGDDGSSLLPAPDRLELVTPEPSVYKLQVPPEPPEHVTRVRPVGKTEPVITRNAGGWLHASYIYSWLGLLETYPEGLEPVPAEPQESEFDAAVRWMRENPQEIEQILWWSTFERHAAVIVRKVLADEPTSAGPDIGTVLRELLGDLTADRNQDDKNEWSLGITVAMHRVERLIIRHTIDHGVRDA